MLDPTLAEFLLFRAIGYVPDLDEWPTWKVDRMIDTANIWRFEQNKRQEREARKLRHGRR